MYANPQVGVEDPLLYRHNYCLSLYFLGYDGCMDYAYQHSFGKHIWKDFDHHKYRDHVFAYPTSNGVVDTIQWEGFREAVDNVRYVHTCIQNCDHSPTIFSEIKDHVHRKELEEARHLLVKGIENCQAD